MYERLRDRYVCALAVCLAAAPLLASQVVPVNLEQMTERAAAIFSGRCLDARVEMDPQIGREITVATFEVQRAVKGQFGSTIEVRTIQENHGGIADEPRFKSGDEVVLFLYGKSSLGLSSPVGLGQGRFSIVTDKHGQRIAVNPFANSNLLRGLTPQAKTRIGTAVLDQWQDREDVDPDALLDMVESLASSAP